MSRNTTQPETHILPGRRHDDRIYALAHRYVRDQNTDGMQRLFDSLCASVHPQRYFRIIEMMVCWMIPNAELADVLDENGEPAAKKRRRKKAPPPNDPHALARLIIGASRDLASTIAMAAQLEPDRVRAWARRLGPDACPDAEAFRQALIEVAP